MTIDEIRDDILNSEKSISEALRKALILAYKLKNADFKQWVDQELEGYSHDADAPNYRYFPTMSYGSFQSFQGIMRHVPIPTLPMPEFMRTKLSNIILFNGVKELENLIKNAEKNELHMPWPPDFIAYYNSRVNTDPHFSCVEAYRVITTSQIIGVLDNIRNKLLKFLLEIEDLFPDVKGVDEISAKVTPSQVINIFQNCIFDKKIEIGSNNSFTGETSIKNQE